MSRSVQTPSSQRLPANMLVTDIKLQDPFSKQIKPPLSSTAAIVCIILVALALRPAIVSVGPLLPEIIDTFGLTHIQASLLTAIPTILMGLMALPAPKLARHFGRDRVIISALILTLISTGLRVFANSAEILFIATFGIGVGIATAGALIAGFIKASYPKNAVLLMSIYATAIALGSTIAAGITGPIAVAAGNWKVGAVVWIIPAIFAVLAWRYAERRVRSNTDLASKGSIYPMPIRNRTAWFIAIFFACNNIVFYAYISWLAPIYVEYGRSSSNAGLILASFTLAFMVANPLFGLLSRNEDRRLALAITSVIALLGAILIAAAPNANPFISVPLAAFGAGGAFTLGMTLPLDNAENSDEANSWNAFVLLFSYVFAASGPIVVGYLHDLTGGFQISLWLIVCISTVMLAVTPFLRPYRLTKL